MVVPDPLPLPALPDPLPFPESLHAWRSNSNVPWSVTLKVCTSSLPSGLLEIRRTSLGSEPSGTSTLLRSSDSLAILSTTLRSCSSASVCSRRMSAFGQLPVNSYMRLTCVQATSWSVMWWYGSVSESESESEFCAPCIFCTHCARFSSSSLSTNGGGPLDSASDSGSSPQPQSVALGEFSDGS